MRHHDAIEAGPLLLATAILEKLVEDARRGDSMRRCARTRATGAQLWRNWYKTGLTWRAWRAGLTLQNNDEGS